MVLQFLTHSSARATWRIVACLLLALTLLGVNAAEAAGPRRADPTPEMLASIFIPLRGGDIPHQPDVTTGRTLVPYATQYDGTPWAGSNCGPAAVAMVLGAFGVDMQVLQVRRAIIGFTGDRSYDAGTSWDSLTRMAQRHGIPVQGHRWEDGSMRAWYLEELDAQSRMGRPSIVLVKFRALPGHENATWWGDHYVVFLGLTADGKVVYHDPAFSGTTGAYKVVDRAVFENAWTTNASGIQRTAIVLGG